MQRIFISLCITFCLIACNSNTSNTNNHQTADVQSTNDSADAVSSSLCYAYMQNMDTIRLNITTTGDTFSGHMLYQLKERDRNNGTLQGTIKGDTLIADYTFSSEGMVSVRQVAFLKQQEGLREGFGELKQKNNQWVFANPRALQFTGFVLTPAACE
ncbi:hypothetical protein FC093_01870 [Ilyomonas limi]|uniref:Uncharacterized protein n=1 Tax=Ilyomonas limi TaxID=2575867 RepID=A0A4U3L9K1_9BACT|nr:hypothetical protein [Ilyomonas limi]TKK71790.1 hypothetical protein FC093_01870 [Ilyomonas limi]